MYSIRDLCVDLKGLGSVLVCAHAKPDADAVGSVCALQMGLASLKIKADAHFPEPIPERLQAFSKESSLVHRRGARDYDAVVVLDTATRDRAGLDWTHWVLGKERVINIDHHVSNSLWGDLNYCEKEAAASAIIVFQILRLLEVTFSSSIANALLAGLMDDTGCFRFSNADARAFRCASDLVEEGADPSFVANELYFSLPRNMLDLRAKALSSLHLLFDGKIAWISVTDQMLEECNAKPEHTEGLVELARGIEGTTGAVFMREVEGGWKFSLRSKNKGFDVNAVADTFGGGGHVAAAGCMIKGDRSNAERQLQERLGEELSRFEKSS